MKELLDGFEVVNNVARLCNAEIFDDVESAIGCELSGKRSMVVKKTDLKKAMLMRLPIISCFNIDHINNSLVFLPESNQEILDTIVMSYGICENRKVLLPATVCVDYLSSITREVVEIPTQKVVENFLGQLKLEKAEKHIKLELDESLESKAQLQKAMINSKTVMEKIHLRWKKKFQRSYKLIDEFFLDDAELALVVYGSNSINAKAAVRKLREHENVGLLRLRVVRPWPDDEIRKALMNVKKIAVVDNKISLGSFGLFYPEIKTCYDGIASNFIAGDIIKVDDFFEIFKRLKISGKERIWMI